MTATMTPTLTHAELAEEYRIAVRLWTEARALYPANFPEITSAEEQLTALETQLRQPETTTSGKTVVPELETQR